MLTMNRFLIEMIVDKYCHHKANRLILVGIVTYYEESVDAECLIFSSSNSIWKYIIDQIIDKSNPNMYNKFINKCFRDDINYEKIVRKINIFRCLNNFIYMNDSNDGPFIEIIKIYNDNNLIYHTLFAEICKILHCSIISKTHKNIALLVHPCIYSKYIHNDNTISLDDYDKKYIVKNISTHNIRICK
jgi:hypothetical protein